MQVPEIHTSNWQMSPKGLGEVLQDGDDILQCVHYIIFISKGEDPLRPQFGSNLREYIDKPITTVAPLVVAELLDVIPRFEPRVSVNSIFYEYTSDHQVTFFLSLQVVGSAEALPYELTYDGTRGPRAFSDGFNNNFL